MKFDLLRQVQSEERIHTSVNTFARGLVMIPGHCVVPHEEWQVAQFSELSTWSGVFGVSTLPVDLNNLAVEESTPKLIATALTAFEA